MAEPDKFHIGVIDLFSILLPGAALAYHVRLLAEQGRFGISLPRPRSEAEGWAMFLIAAYILGHFIFVFGSRLDSAYDGVLTWLRAHQNAASRAKLRVRLPLWVVDRLKIDRKFQPLRAAMAIKDLHVGPISSRADTINAFQWTKCRLALDHPVALAHVQRFEADSKFFRSLFVVLLVLIASFAASAERRLALVSLACAVASLWRYADQRFKSTRQAYWYLVTLESKPKDARK